MVEPRAKWQEVLGVTLECDVGGICTTSIFRDRVQDMVQGANASMPVLLGRVMAHGIGHLLLGANSHSSAGIMHSRWFGEDLTLAGRRHMLFTAEQSRQMKTRLTERAHTWQTKAVGLGR